MKLATENYKGIAIRCVKNIIGNRAEVEAKWTYKGKNYNIKAPTKEQVLADARTRINRII